MKHIATTLIFWTLVISLSAQCTEDCVWPGDLNSNGIANHMDVLALGLAFGESGPARIDDGTEWEAKEAEDWPGALPVSNVNYKHVDANGTGLITLDDQFPIVTNYNLTNDNFTGLLGNNFSGDDLFVVPQSTTTSPGGSLIYDIHLGTAANPIDQLYGIGFMLELDTQYVADVFFDFSDSWLGPEEDLLTLGKFVISELDHAAVGMTRLDGISTSGFGKIASLEIVITDVIVQLDIDTTACLPFNFKFKNVLALNEFEEDLMISANEGSSLLKHTSQITDTNERDKDIPANCNIFPNPAKDGFQIQMEGDSPHFIKIRNQLGQVIFEKNLEFRNESNITISRNRIPAGSYFIELIFKDGKGISRPLIFID